MLTKERRPMTETERKIVQDELASTLREQGCVSRFGGLLSELGCGLILGGFLVFLALAAWEWLAGLLHKPGLSPVTYRVLVSIGACGGLILAGRGFFHDYRHSHRLSGKLRQTYEGYLEAGEAEVWHCEVSRVVQLEEQEDEGPGFFLELAPGQVLFLQGQYFYDLLGDEFGQEDEEGVSKPPHENHEVWPPPPRTASPQDNRVFPCRRFDLVYAPNSRLLLDLVCLGERFKEWRTYSPDLETYLKTSRDPEDGDILPVSLDTLDADLMRWAVGQEQGKA